MMRLRGAIKLAAAVCALLLLTGGAHAGQAAREQAAGLTLEIARMAEGGDMQAQYILGYAYYTGQETKISDEKALEWWQKAAKQGHREADAYIGLSFADGFGGSLKNQAEAVRRYKRAAQSGSPLAQLLLGIYKYQTGAEEDKSLAIGLFRSSSEAGNELAKGFLNEILAKGFELQRDFGRGIRWREEAAKVSVAQLCTQAGVNAHKGQFVDQNYSMAAAWWEIAARYEDPKAGALLGAAYYTGRGVDRDVQKAAELLRWFAEKKEPLAQFTLGKAFMEGNGVPKDKRKAVEYLRAASYQGIEEAKKIADKLEEES